MQRKQKDTHLSLNDARCVVWAPYSFILPVVLPVIALIILFIVVVIVTVVIVVVMVEVLVMWQSDVVVDWSDILPF